MYTCVEKLIQLYTHLGIHTKQTHTCPDLVKRPNKRKQKKRKEKKKKKKKEKQKKKKKKKRRN